MWSKRKVNCSTGSWHSPTRNRKKYACLFPKLWLKWETSLYMQLSITIYFVSVAKQSSIECHTDSHPTRTCAFKNVYSIGEDHSSVDYHQLRKSTEEIQNLVLALLNKTIAEKLTSSVLSLRETYLGTLQRFVTLFQNLLWCVVNVVDAICT